MIELWSSASSYWCRFLARTCKIRVACRNSFRKRIWDVDFAKWLLVRTFDSRGDGPQNSLLSSHHSVSDVNERFRKVRRDELMCNIICLVAQEKLRTKRVKCFKFVHFLVFKPRPCKQVGKFYMLGYLFISIGFPLSGSGPYTCTQKARAVIFIRRNKAEHRTQKIECKT